MLKNSHPRFTRTLFTAITALAGIIILIGLFVMLNLGKKTKDTLTESLLLRAQNAALFVDPEAVEAMKGDESDILLPEYIELKEKLIALRDINPDIRFIYIMGYNGTNLFFHVDSEDPLSEDYSPPGQEYQEASQEEMIGYFSNKSYVIGPYEDRWGRWVSAMAPIIDETTGNRVAVVGVDLSADDYESQLVYVQGTVIVIAILIASLIFVLGLFIRKSTQHMNVLSSEYEKLATTKGELEKIQKMVKLGKWRWTPKSSFVSFDDMMYQLTGVPVDRKVTYPYFLSIMVPEDRALLDSALASANTNASDTFAITYKILRPDDAKTIVIRSNCTVERDGNGGVSAVSGTAQEIE